MRHHQGSAILAIEGFLLYPTDQSYRRARQISEEPFVARPFITVSMPGSIISGELPHDQEHLPDNVNKLVSCAKVVEH